MTDKQIRECLGVMSSVPDRVLRNDEEILQSIKNNIGFTKIFDDERVNGVLQEIRQEIEDNVLETLSDGGDDWFTADKVNDCIEIIDKHIKEIEE